MTKNILSSILIGLLSVLAVACGDAGNAAFDEDLSPGDVLAGNQEEVDPDPELGGENDGVDPDAGEGGELGNDDKPPVVAVEAACGDGFVDPLERCDDGNTEDGDGCSSACEVEARGQITIDVLIDNLASNDEPAVGTCADVIDLAIGVETVSGSGTCVVNEGTNALSYSVDLDLAADGAVDGEVEIILNGGSHVLDAKGTFEDDVFFFSFEGVTLITQGVRAIWQGEQKATLD
ncbi:MAG: DUF4215 domain-containing protein [Polyangiales bacterium]